MSLYNMVSGVHPTAGHVLEFLGIDVDDCGRFRDAYITKEGELAIYTRCGGGNHHDYQDVYDKFATHPQYLRYEYDDFDSTFSTFYFDVPAKYTGKVVEYINTVKDSHREDLFLTPMERFLKVVDNIKG